MNDKSKGLGIGMAICVIIGIALSELGIYHIDFLWCIIFGSAVGLIIGAILERQDNKNEYVKKGMIR